MLYSVGYQNLKNIETLKDILEEKGIKILLDVRSRPYGRKALFNKKKLETFLPASGIDYIWAGKTLGGFSEINEEDIKKLAGWQKGKIVCLVCMEADPDRCHRKNEIARRLKKYGVSVNHIETKLFNI
jgi:uncharacterized protein (DUF488 family)